MSKSPRMPWMLIILDGWGNAAASDHNAITLAKTPFWDQLMENNPQTLISASGEDVGLPGQQMGNSEVGHMNLGAGRPVYQALSRINREIDNGEFDQNPVLLAGLKQAKQTRKRIHIIGLLSPGGVHSHQDQIFALCRLAKREGIEAIYLHAFLDGRDTPPKSAMASLHQTQALLDELGVGSIASIMGRYYAMDRDNRWDRIEQAYQALVVPETNQYCFASAAQALTAAYDRDETDEFVLPTVIAKDQATARSQAIEDDDVVFFMNFRADRARQLSRAFIDQDFTAFKRQPVHLNRLISLTEYAADIHTQIAYPAEVLENSLGEVAAKQGLTQLRIAETEKYAHVTFFFSGGREQPFNGEDRVLIPSPKVARYDLAPQMSANEVTDRLVQAILNKEFDLIVCNYANGDMVGHTGNLAASIMAVETLDRCLARLHEALQQVGGAALITADHGNVEKMMDHQTDQPHTAHTNELVPFVYMGPDAVKVVAEKGVLADVAPTLLALMGVAIPEQMTGKPIFEYMK